MNARTQLATLPNGVRIATVEMPYMESVSIGFWTGVGTRHETAENNGVAHFLEHLLFKGTPTRSAEAISRQVERVGGSIDAFTSEDHTAYQVKGPADKLEPLLEVLADLYQHPRFDPADIDLERNVIREEIAMVRDQPAQWLEDLSSEAAWPDHPLGRPITGTTASLERLDRGAVAEFHRAAYTSSQTVVSVAGRIAHAEVLERLTPLLSGMASGPALAALPAPPPAPGFAFARSDDLEQAHLSIAFHARGRHDASRYAQKLLNVLLGENSSSRLFQEVRESEGLCYEIQSDIMAFEDTGLINIYVALDPGEIGRALKTVRKIVESFSRVPPSVSDLEEAKSYLIGQSRIALENTATQMMWAGECLLSFNEVIDPESVHRRIAAVSATEICDLAGQLFFPDRLVVTGIGPRKMERVLREWSAGF